MSQSRLFGAKRTAAVQFVTKTTLKNISLTIRESDRHPNVGRIIP
jgi:hypothetical protein